MTSSDIILSAMIEFGATGQQSISDVGQRIRDVQKALADLQAGFKAGTVPIVDFDKQGLQLAKTLNDLEERLVVLNRLAAGKPANIAPAMEANQRATRGATQAVLELSRGLEDFAVAGPIGALNNLGRMVGGVAQACGAAAPQVAALEAGASILATAAFVCYRNWDTLKKAFVDTVPPKLLGDLKELEERIKALEKIEIKTAVDYNDLRNAREELRKLQEEEATYRRLKDKKSEEQQKRSDLVSSAIVEGGGTGDYTSGVDNVTAAVKQARGKYATPEMVALEEELKRAQESERDLEKSGFDTEAIQRKQIDLEAKIKAQAILDDQNRGRTARDLVTHAADGNSQSLAELARLFGANEAAFTDRGVDPLRFGAGLENAADPYAEERRKLALKRAQEAKDIKDAEQEAQIEADLASGPALGKQMKEQRRGEARDRAEHGRQVGEQFQRVDQGYHDKLAAAFYESAKAGGSMEEAAARKELVPDLRNRNVPENVVSDVAQRIVEKARDAALNAIASGEPPKLVKEAAAARDKAVGEQARRFAPGVDDELERAMLAHYAGGMDAQQSLNRLMPQLARRLGGNGVPADMQQGVADAILRKVSDKVANAIEEMVHAGSSGPRGAAQGLLMLNAAKAEQAGRRNQAAINKGAQDDAALGYAQQFQQITGVNDAAAMQAGRQMQSLVDKGLTVEQAGNQVWAHMASGMQQVQRSMLRMQAGSEAMMGVLGSATQALGVIDARNAQLQRNVQMIQGNLNRNSQRRPTLQTHSF